MISLVLHVVPSWRRAIRRHAEQPHDGQADREGRSTNRRRLHQLHQSE
jgi:hypothetical protein